MHTPDRYIASARSKAHTRDSRKDERASFTRAIRRAGKVRACDVEVDAGEDSEEGADASMGVDCDMTREEAMAAEFARWEVKREVARVIG